MRSYRIRLLPWVMAIAPAHSGASRRLGRRIRTHSRLKVRGTLSTYHLPSVCRLPSTTSASQALQPRPCSAASSVLRSSLTSQRRISSACAYWLPDALCASRRRSTLGSPGSRVKCFLARMRSQTARGPRDPRQIGSRSVAFGVATAPQHPGLSQRLRARWLFRGSIPSSRVPLSTLRLHRYRCLRMTRGRRGWLNLQRMTPSFTTLYRSPGARGLTIRSTGQIAACRHLPRHFILGQMSPRHNVPVSSNVRPHRHRRLTS